MWNQRITDYSTGLSLPPTFLQAAALIFLTREPDRRYLLPLSSLVKTLSHFSIVLTYIP